MIEQYTNIQAEESDTIITSGFVIVLCSFRQRRQQRTTHWNTQLPSIEVVHRNVQKRRLKG
jgi:hypothetical protein